MTRGLKRSGRLLAGGLALALVAAGCGFGGDDEGGGGDSGDGTTISFLVPQYSDNTKPLWEEIIKGFEADNPDISVDLEMQSWDNINDVVRTKLQSPDTTPDILNIDAYASFANDDLLYKAEDVLSSETVDDIEPAFAENASLDGTMYGMPLFASTRALFYNKDLFKQAGIKTPPKTWDELLTDAEKLSKLDGVVGGYGMPLGNEEAQAETSIWTFGAGGSWGDTDELTIDTDENLAGVEQMQKMIDAGATQDDPGATDRTPMLNVFMQGKIAMAEGLPPIVGQIEADYPDLNYGIAPIPTESGDSVTLGVADHLMAFDKGDSAKQDAIRSFLDYFYSAKVYANFVKTEGFIPITKSAGKELSDDPAIKPFLATLSDAKFYPSNNPAWPAAQGAMQQQIGTIGQGADPADVLGKIAEAAESGS
ncbi:extracellular solute-binding protein [Nocardioidaceae bacterium SCSIO 66511]|nr:extracellular solute-binding protein [Nocardioidaceae bacterium SCSIO 66511]